MVGTTLTQQLKNFIQTMHDQGILDHHFDHVKNLQTEENPNFVLEVISMFLNDAEAAMAELTRCLGEPVVDYDKVTSVVHQLRGSGASIGGLRMALACRELRHATDDKDRQRCLETFERVKQEHHILQDNLNLIAQMERAILTSDTRRRQA